MISTCPCINCLGLGRGLIGGIRSDSDVDQTVLDLSLGHSPQEEVCIEEAVGRIPKKVFNLVLKTHYYFSVTRTTIKWLLMPYCCSHRSVPHSSLTREASFWDRWELTWRHWQLDNAESQSIWSPQSYLRCLYVNPVLKTQESTWKRKLKDSKNKRWWMIPKKTQHLLDTTGLWNIWTHKDCASMQITYTGSRRMGFQHSEGEVAMESCL